MEEDSSKKESGGGCLSTIVLIVIIFFVVRSCSGAADQKKESDVDEPVEPEFEELISVFVFSILLHTSPFNESAQYASAVSASLSNSAFMYKSTTETASS